MIFDIPAGQVRVVRLLRERWSSGSLYCVESPQSKPWVGQRLPGLLNVIGDEFGIRMHPSWAYGLMRDRVKSPLPLGLVVSRIELGRLNELLRHKGCFVWTHEIDAWSLQPDLDALD